MIKQNQKDKTLLVVTGERRPQIKEYGDLGKLEGARKWVLRRRTFQ